MVVRLAGIKDAFRSRNFRIYWVGNLTHVITVWINRLAVGWITWELTGSGTWLGAMAAASMLPSVIFGPIGGVTADRFGHRRQLCIATYIGAVIALAAAIFVVTDSIFVELLFALTLLSGVSRAFNVPARQAMVYALVERKYLSSAMGIQTSTFHGGNFVGPALGGLVVAQFGVAPAFFAYAAGEAIAATSFLMLRFAPGEDRGGSKDGIFRGLIIGARYTASHRGILSLLAVTAIVAMLLQPYIDMLPGFAAKVFDRGADGLGLLSASTGAGAMAGGLWLAGRGRTEGLVQIFLIGVALACVTMIGFVATNIMIIGMVALLLVGFGLVSAHTAATTLIQNAVAQEVRARVMSFSGVIGVSGPALGAILIGWAANIYGFQLPMGVSAGLALIAFLWAMRNVRRYAPAMERGPDTGHSSDTKGSSIRRAQQTSQ